MAAGDGSEEPGDNTPPQVPSEPALVADASDEEGDEDDEEDEEEEEPRLKYATLTRNVSPLYRNGDATSAFIVTGDKMASPYL